MIDNVPPVLYMFLYSKNPIEHRNCVYMLNSLEHGQLYKLYYELSNHYAHLLSLKVCTVTT